MDSPINPDIVLNELCSNATNRTKSSLTILHQVLEKISQEKPLDFSIVNVGKKSEQQGGPSTQTIRNRTGKHFQQLIETWAAFAGTSCKKPLSVRQKQLINTNEQSILDAIEDPVIRAVVGTLIAERNKYRDQLNVMKANADIIIDRTQPNQNGKMNINRSTSLTPMEVEALKTAISEEFFSKMGWQVMPTGQVKDSEGKEIYKRGYANILNNIINNVQNASN